MKKMLLAAVLVLGSLSYVFVNRATAGESGTTPITLTTATETSSAATLPSSTGATPPAPAPTARPVTVPPTPKPTSTGAYRNGTYTGSVADAYYGNIQVAAVISGGKLTNVRVLQYPNDRGTSIEINSQALPMLIQEAISAQSSRVDTISGASDTSAAFRESLATALSAAKA